MIELRDPDEPVWLDLPQGVRVRCAVLDPVVEVAGRQVFWATLRDAGDDADLARARLAEIEELARRSISAWEGVAHDCTPENRVRLMHQPGMALAFATQRELARERWSAEGNASATSPNGTGGEAAAPAIAPAA